MAVFAYKAKDSEGNIKSGKLDAKNKKELERKLRNLRLSVLFSKEEKDE